MCVYVPTNETLRLVSEAEHLEDCHNAGGIFDLKKCLCNQKNSAEASGKTHLVTALRRLGKDMGTLSIGHVRLLGGGTGIKIRIFVARVMIRIVRSSEDATVAVADECLEK